jgi:hypothetical protein
MWGSFSWPLLALLATNSNTIKSYIKTDHLLLQQIKETPNGVVWVDLENVRGKSGFALNHMQVLDKTTVWMRHHQLEGKVIVMADHGSKQCAYYLLQKDLAVVFAGPSEKADDTIAHGVSLFPQGIQVVITADGELQSRCRRYSPPSSKMHIMDPTKFLDDLELAALQSSGIDEPEEDEETSSLSLGEQVQLGKLDDEIRLRAQLLDAEIQLDKKKTMTNKRRKKLQAKINLLRTKLALRGRSLLDQLTSIDTSAASVDGIDRYQQDLLLSRWREIQHRSSRREQTGDRVVYAENLRRQLLEREDIVQLQLEDGVEEDDSPAKAFVMQINGILDPASVREITTGVNGEKSSQMEPTQEIHNTLDEEVILPPEQSTYDRLNDSANPIALDKLTIVAVSDTHGFEGQMTDPVTLNGILPDGDVLLHLGDFARDGSHETEFNGLRAFDRWLAKQPHKYKIIVRGNHDPWTFDFPLSGAWYITQPATIAIGAFLLAAVPFGSPRKLAAGGGIPSSCDILATHVPPFKTLDRSYSGKSVGSPFLTKMVRSMGQHAPRLWLCGHIHEGRGVAKRQFGKGGETTVINAANANRGRATHLEHGAVVVQLEAASDQVAILEMKDKTIDKMIPSNANFFETTEAPVNELLMAVDLGLKSGVSLFNCQGELVRYEQFYFEKETLQKTAQNLIATWEQDVNIETEEESTSLPSKVTHIAIEGADGYMLRAWADAAPHQSILRVSPEEWRSDLLLAKESTSGANSKAAARLIARQVVQDFGVMEAHTGKFPTDVAEAVVMGLYVARKLGWITREPAVRRYTNGNIVLPKK